MLFLLPELFGKLFFWATLNGKKRNGCFVKHIHLTKGKRDIKHLGHSEGFDSDMF